MKNTLKRLGIAAITAVITLFSLATCEDPTKQVAAYTVTFNGNGATSGAAPAAMTADKGSVITLPGTGANYNAGASCTVAGNTTLYARWVENPPYHLHHRL